MHLLADLRRPSDRLPDVARKERARDGAVCVAGHHRGERDDGHGQQIGGRLNHVTGRRFNAADDAFDRRERAQPVRHVRELWTGDAGEEIFRAAGETSNLVRHGGADDEHEIVAAVGNPRR